MSIFLCFTLNIKSEITFDEEFGSSVSSFVQDLQQKTDKKDVNDPKKKSYEDFIDTVEKTIGSKSDELSKKLHCTGNAFCRVNSGNKVTLYVNFMNHNENSDIPSSNDGYKPNFKYISLDMEAIKPYLKVIEGKTCIMLDAFINNLEKLFECTEEIILQDKYNYIFIDQGTKIFLYANEYAIDDMANKLGDDYYLFIDPLYNLAEYSESINKLKEFSRTKLYEQKNIKDNIDLRSEETEEMQEEESA
ncbi:hypothetical protein [Candidatus Nesciobacter abundans]|uniref:Uncharacterized protein n=1 Tax=Candidatus Nesciobacter abundans TaxID=2601668 RepID=A0A5C0UGQ1_9PROT|nr:hypothetical protein [Candidatus Nesciobacter abundans]QEK38989.1 hypothetical protein FZC36_00880 [Candidatus Nesciobacter abundans]